MVIIVIIVIIASGKIEWASVSPGLTSKTSKSKRKGEFLLMMIIAIIIIASEKIVWASVYPWVDIIIIASGKIEWASVYPWVDRQNKQKQGRLLPNWVHLPALSPIKIIITNTKQAKGRGGSFVISLGKKSCFPKKSINFLPPIPCYHNFVGGENGT